MTSPTDRPGTALLVIDPQNGVVAAAHQRDAVLANMREYMDFAWGKVEDHRGISASRSVEKFGAWIWALGDEETLRKFEATNYAPYGAPQLAFVCATYGFPIPGSSELARMIDGEPCIPGCQDGCRS